MPTKVAVPVYGSTNRDGSVNRFDPNTGLSTAPSGGGSSSSNINQYNPNTGALLTPGQTVQIGNTGNYVTQGTPWTPTSNIAFSDLNNRVNPLDTFNPNQNLDLYNTGINQSKGVLGSYYNPDGTLKNEQQVGQVSEQNSNANLMSQLSALAGIEASKPSQAELYRQAQNETGILAKQEEVGRLSGQLNGIVAQGQVNQLSVVGQGRGIPEAILGGQQAQFARETAIQSLPVAAQLSAAQGNLEMANQNLTTLFSIKQADAKSKYDYQVKVIDTISQFATKQEETKLASVNKQLDRQYNEKQAEIAKADSYAKMALANGQGTLAGKIGMLDHNSPTYKTDLAKLTSQIKDPMQALDMALKRAQIASANRANAGGEAPDVKSINGTDMQWDGSKWIPAVTGATGNKNIVKNTLFNERIAQTNKMLGVKEGEVIIQDSNGVYKIQDAQGKWREFPGGSGLAGTTGPNALSRNSFDFDIFTGVRSNFIADINQLTNQATIDNLIAVKKAGGTFGALSERELGLLEQSSSKIASYAIHQDDDPNKKVIGYNTSEANLKQELAKLQMHLRAFQEADTGSSLTPEEATNQYYQSSLQSVETVGQDYYLGVYNTN